jgi:hypothetical protein
MTALSKFCALSLALGTIPAITAAPIQRADVPADAAWVLHLDLDALRSTAIGKHILSEMSKPENENKLAAFQASFGIDLKTDMHGMTVFSAGPAPEDGVLLAYADFDSERLTNIARGAKDYKSVSHRKHTIHNWEDDKKKPGKDGLQPRTYAAIQGKHVIFGQREAAVASALDIGDGMGKHLAGTKAFPQLGTGKGGFLQAAARKLDLPQNDPNAAVFKMAKMMTLNVAESGQDIVGNLAVEAADDQVAGHMVSIAQGLLSLMKLNSAKQVGVALAEALAIKQDGAIMNVNLSMPGSKIIDMMKAADERKKAASN